MYLSIKRTVLFLSCAEKEASDVGQTLQDILDENGLHHNMIAKKFHEKRSSEEVCVILALVLKNVK